MKTILRPIVATILLVSLSAGCAQTEGHERISRPSCAQTNHCRHAKPAKPRQTLRTPKAKCDKPKLGFKDFSVPMGMGKCVQG